MSDYYYTKNNYILDSPLNKTFSEVHFMPDDEFRVWLKSFAGLVRNVRENHGVPFELGKTDAEITTSCRELVKTDVCCELVEDSVNYEVNCIDNKNKTLNIANAFFPNMEDAKDNMGSKKMSVSGLFQDDEVRLVRQ